MAETPPKELVALLERLGLASARQVAGAARHVRRLARDLPRFDSVWIDALASDRVLSPFQAAELNAGRGELLRVGPYVLCERLAHPYYIKSYRARSLAPAETVRLAVVDDAGPRGDAMLRQIESLGPVVRHADIAGKRLFVAAPWRDGRTAAEWMTHHGRFPPEVVLEIARAMATELAAWEKQHVVHGDIGAASLVLGDAGEVSLVFPGLRGVLRPEEGYAHADLPPEAFDTLAPERVASGTPPSAASDIFACGCLWWQLLCGRPALAGGDALARLRAAQVAKVDDVRRHAPGAPPALADAIAACIEVEANRRPASMARLAAMLGQPTSDGRQTVAECLMRSGRPAVHWTTTARAVRRSSRTPLWLAAVACCLVAAIAVLWPSSRRGQGETSSVAAPNPVRSAGNRTDSLAEGRRSTTATPSVSKAESPASTRQPPGPPADLVLPIDRPLRLARLDPRPGQCVRAAERGRATVLVPSGGLLVDKEDVRFENIDFVGTSAAGVPEGAASLVRLLAGKAEFRGCRFRDESAGARSVAVRWTHPARADATETSLPNGQVRFVGCILQGIDAGVECHTIGAASVEWTNSLRLDGGPLVRLDHCPQSDEPVAIRLSQVTLRGGGPLLECRVPREEGQPGEIGVVAEACVFTPSPGEPLTRFVGAASQRLAGVLRWTGHGSVVTPATPILALRAADGKTRTVDEAALSMAGLVRGTVNFAGAASGDPAASRVLRWQAPLTSSDPPGVDPSVMTR